jgi:hypothetical protein
MKRKNQQRELQTIEKILHPTPTINGVNILHEHTGKRINFSAWKDGVPHRGICTMIGVPRRDVLNHGTNFYPTYYDSLEKLVRQA